MKSVFQLFLVVVLVLFASCRETKKEEVKAESVVPEKIETIDTKVDDVASEIEKEEKELEKDLNELDQI